MFTCLYLEKNGYFRRPDTERLFRRESVRRFKAIERQALRKLDVLDAAPDLRTLAALPGNRLERLKGDRKDQWSIRVYDQWRIRFIWQGGEAFDVEIGGYHHYLNLSMNALALALRVPVTRIADIVNERRGITADTALRLARYFNNSPPFWMNLQTRYDLEVANDEISEQVRRDVRPLATASR